jgi:hypothetical protein
MPSQNISNSCATFFRFLTSILDSCKVLEGALAFVMSCTHAHCHCTVMCAAFEEQSLMFVQGAVQYDEVFSDYIRWCAEQYWEGSGAYYAPFLVLFQSSMTGKSRLLKELAQSTFFTIMVCVREESVMMQPQRTQAVADALLKERIASSEALMAKLLNLYLKEFQKWVLGLPAGEGDPKDWYSHQKTVDMSVGKALGASELHLDMLDWASVTQKLGQHPAFSCLHILFVFDEARSLLKHVDKQGMTLFRSEPTPYTVWQACDDHVLSAYMHECLGIRVHRCTIYVDVQLCVILDLYTCMAEHL